MPRRGVARRLRSPQAPWRSTAALAISRSRRGGQRPAAGAIAEALRARDGDRAGELLERHILWARDLAIAQLPLSASAPRGASAG